MFDHSISKDFLMNLIANIIMFIPTGMIIPFTEKNMKITAEV